MEYKVEPIIISRENPGKLDYIEFDEPYELNSYFADACKVKDSPKLSITVLSHKNLESLTMCIDCVLRFAEGIDYELVLMDNSSDDGDETYDFMQSIPYKRKKIIKMQDNMGPYFDATRGWQTLWNPTYCEGDYILHLNDDINITENAVQNMIRALDENPDTGMVISKSSNAAFGQDPRLIYSSDEEMFEAAKEFNVYDPGKWEERLVISLVMPMFRRELIYCMHTSSPFGFEVYQEDAIRRAGYRVFLMGDTWVDHRHNYGEKATYGFMAQTPEGEKIRRNIDELSKHVFHGIKLKIGDIGGYCEAMGFENELVSLINEIEQEETKPSILSIDTKAGQGLLDVKNALRSQGIFECTTTAYTTDERYYPWLFPIADEVFVDRIELTRERLNNRCFDYIIVGKPINLFKTDPLKLLDVMLDILNPGGKIFFKLRNTASAKYALKMMDYIDVVDEDMPIIISPHEVINHVASKDFAEYNTGVTSYPDDESLNIATDYIIAGASEEKDAQELRTLLQAKDFLLMIPKPIQHSSTDISNSTLQAEQHYIKNEYQDLQSEIKDQPAEQKKKPSKINREGYYEGCRLEILALITQNESEPISVLEIGCSSGGTLATIKQTWPNSKVKGIEIVPEVAQEAKSKGLDVECCNIEEVELPYEKESFDYIIMADVIEHLREPEEVLRDLIPFLKKGGSFLCSIPNVQHVSVVTNLMKGRFDYADAGILDRTHLRFFTMFSVKQLFTETNLSIEHLQGITWAPGGITLADIKNESTDSKKLFEYQQILVSAKKV